MAAVIANGNLKDPTIRDIIRVFEGKTKTWGDGSPMVVFVLPRENVATQEFAWKVLKMSPHAFEDKVNNLEANAQGSYLRRVETEAQMLRSVSLTIGATGYMKNIILLNSGGGLVKIVPLD